MHNKILERELEDLMIDAIYLDILRGKLDQSKELFEVEYTMGRDLESGKLYCSFLPSPLSHFPGPQQRRQCS